MIGGAFGAAVRAARLRLGLTQEHLARDMGRTQTWLSYIEGGHREPTLADLDAICRALGITFPLAAAQEPPAHRECPYCGLDMEPGEPDHVPLEEGCVAPADDPEEQRDGCELAAQEPPAGCKRVISGECSGPDDPWCACTDQMLRAAAQEPPADPVNRLVLADFMHYMKQTLIERVKSDQDNQDAISDILDAIYCYIVAHRLLPTQEPPAKGDDRDE